MKTIERGVETFYGDLDLLDAGDAARLVEAVRHASGARGDNADAARALEELATRELVTVARIFRVLILVPILITSKLLDEPEDQRDGITREHQDKEEHEGAHPEVGHPLDLVREGELDIEASVGEREDREQQVTDQPAMATGSGALDCVIRRRPT